MNLEEFLARLRKTPRDWKLTGASHTRIRIELQDESDPLLSFELCCPITCLVSKNAGWVHDVAKDLGIEDRLKTQIIAAADWPVIGLGGEEIELRKKLLEVCSLA